MYFVRILIQCKFCNWHKIFTRHFVTGIKTFFHFILSTSRIHVEYPREIFSLKFSKDDAWDEDVVDDKEEGAGDGVSLIGNFCFPLPLLVDDATSACRSSCRWFSWSSSMLGRGERVVLKDCNSCEMWVVNRGDKFLSINSVLDTWSDIGTICSERWRRNLRLGLVGDGWSWSDEVLSILIQDDSSCL